MKLDQAQIANEMRRTASVLRDAGQGEIADCNEQIAEYIEGLECGLAAERKLSIRRTGERNAAQKRIAELEAELLAAKAGPNYCEFHEPRYHRDDGRCIDCEIEKREAAAKDREAQLAEMREQLTFQVAELGAQGLQVDVDAILDEFDIPKREATS